MISTLALLILIIIFGFGAYFWVYQTSILEKFLSNQLNAEVMIEETSLSWSKFSIKGFRLKNPLPSPQPYAFQTHTITVETTPFQLLKKTIHIKNIEVINTTIGVELYNSSGSDNNWSRLLSTFPSRGSKKLMIDKLTIADLNFDILRSNGKPLSVPPIALLEFEDLGKDNPLTPAEVGRVIFQTILSSLLNKPHLGALLNNIKALPEKLLEGISSPLPFEGAKRPVKEGLNKIRRKTQEASEFLQDLFSK